MGKGNRDLNILLMALLFSLSGCSKTKEKVVELKRFPINNKEELITRVVSFPWYGRVFLSRIRNTHHRNNGLDN